MAHITGGGIEGNLCRIIPDGLCAVINLQKLNVPEIFRFIRRIGNISDDEMLRTFNCGVGLLVVVQAEDKQIVLDHINRFYPSWEIGTVLTGFSKVSFRNTIQWD